MTKKESSEKNPKWYAIYTKSRNEKKVASSFEKSGIPYYLPLIQRERIWSDRRKKILEPLFSSYIFVNIPDNLHYPVLKTDGVVKFVSFQGEKVPVKDQEIEAIKRYIKTGEELIENESDYKVGKKVRITRGGMKNLEGRLVEILGRQRVRVEIESVGQSVFVRIPKGSLEIIGEYDRDDRELW
jgi:transcription antitermination factor NusG